MHRVGNRLDVVQDAVDAEADDALVLARLDVDVRGALVEGVAQQEVDRGDHVLVVVVGDLFAGAQLHELDQGAVRIPGA